MDGNDSLKRVLRRSLDDDDDSLGESSKLPTGQLLVSDRYLSRDFVDQFAWDTPCAMGDSVSDWCVPFAETTNTVRVQQKTCAKAGGAIWMMQRPENLGVFMMKLVFL